MLFVITPFLKTYYSTWDSWQREWDLSLTLLPAPGTLSSCWIPSLGFSSCGALGLVQCVIHDWLKDMEVLHFSEDKEEGEGWGKCLEGED